MDPEKNSLDFIFPTKYGIPKSWILVGDPGWWIGILGDNLPININYRAYIGISIESWLVNRNPYNGLL